MMDEEEEELYKEYLFQLGQSHVAAQRALDILYERGGPKRSLLVRMLLGRAQSILIGLYVQELSRQGEKT